MCQSQTNMPMPAQLTHKLALFIFLLIPLHDTKGWNVSGFAIAVRDRGPSIHHSRSLASQLSVEEGKVMEDIANFARNMLGVAPAPSVEEAKLPSGAPAAGPAGQSPVVSPFAPTAENTLVCCCQGTWAHIYL